MSPDPRTADDKLSNVFLQSYVVGSQTVIQKSKELLETSSDDGRAAAVKDLLEAMRADVGLPKINIGKFPPLYLPKNEGSFPAANEKK